MTIQVSKKNEDGVVTLLMDRPEKRNAFTWDMYEAFGAAFDALEADDEVRCVILRGAGGNFCSGSDIGGFDESRSGIEQAKVYADFTVAMFDKLKYLRHPTVACIEGVCVGGGLEIAALCDLRIAQEDARFGIPVNRIGLTLDHRELVDLATVVGHIGALEILLEGRVFGAQEAQAKGLLSRVVENAWQDASDTASRIAKLAPLSNRWHKKFIRQLQSGQTLTQADRDEAYECFETEDYRLGSQAFLNKQRPQFTGR
jgi:enoyl-CoA hydratase